jgi:predicted acyltransferase
MTQLANQNRSIAKEASKPGKPAAVDGRIKAIDQFRGLVIILMVVINYGITVQSVPSWLKHAPDVGMYFADLGAPVFIFAIGLTYGLSFQRRRARDGLPVTVMHFIRRYLAILGIGAILAAGKRFVGMSDSAVDWGVLQTLGCCGLLTLLVIRLPTGIRLAVGLGLLAAYQVCLDTYWLDSVMNSPHGGLAGSLSWSVILIIATVFADLYHDVSRRKYFPVLSFLFFVVGLLLALVVPVSKVRVSASYDLVSLGFCGIVFSVFYLANFELRFFSAWGQNPLLLYFLSLLLTGFFMLPGIPGWHVQAPLWLAGLQAAGLVLILGAAALYWQKIGFRFSL